jgi:hypothetical protein
MTVCPDCSGSCDTAPLLGCDYPVGHAEPPAVPALSDPSNKAKKEMAMTKVEIELSDETMEHLRGLVEGDDTLEVVASRAAALGAAVFYRHALDPVEPHADVTAAFANLTDPENYGG